VLRFRAIPGEFSLMHSIRTAVGVHSISPPLCLVFFFVSLLRVFLMCDAVIRLFCVTGVFWLCFHICVCSVWLFLPAFWGAAYCLPFAILIGPLPLYAAS
jgi:hypothetical protein